jgi:hypothetical protein
MSSGVIYTDEVRCVSDKTEYIMVLEDGRTFSSLYGCAIWEVPEDWETERIEAALKGDPHEEGDEQLIREVTKFCYTLREDEEEGVND